MRNTIPLMKRVCHTFQSRRKQTQAPLQKDSKCTFQQIKNKTPKPHLYLGFGTLLTMFIMYQRYENEKRKYMYDYTSERTYGG